MFESLFTFLFKYPALVFEQGSFVLAASRSMRLAATIAAVAGIFVLWTYRQLAAVPRRDRVVLLTTRLALSCCS